MAAETSYDGGVGGKFSRRSNRKHASTPYDRPPSALRPAFRGINAEGERKGWWSKLVDSAPRMIANTASKFLPSFGTRYLTAPNPTQALDTGIVVREEASGSIPDSSNVPNQSPSNNSCKENPDADGISELEKLLAQKTFSRAESDRLAELLRSRTVGSPESKASEPNASTPDKQLDTEKNLSMQIFEDRINDPRLFVNNTKATTDVNVPGKEIASPAELAKAYMGSRPSKLSTTISAMQSPIFREATPLSSNRPPLPKPSDSAVAPRSMVRLPGLSENGYKTPMSQGRSAIYKMSRSPYFKAQPFRSAEPSGESHAGVSSAQLVPSNVSDVKQVLKRRSSFVENDVGSFGPIRRIRQKSNFLTPEKEVTGKYLLTAANDMIASVSSFQKPLLADSLPSERVAPTKSVRMATKIFQQLDLLASPPKEKTSELISVDKDESPSKLSISMLHGQARISLKDIDASKIFSFEEKKHCSSSNAKDHNISISQKGQAVLNNSATCPSVDTRLTAAPDGHIITATAASQKKPAFLMQVPEISSDGDVENQGGNDTPNIRMGNSMQVLKAITSDISPKKTPFSSSETKFNPDFVPIKESEKKCEIAEVPGEDNGFSFPLSSSKSSISQPPPTPTMPSPALKPSATPEEEGLGPVFSFGSGKATSLAFSSVVSDTKACVTSDSKADIFLSASTTKTTQLELPKFSKGKETEKIEDPLKPLQSSTIFSSVAGPGFGFGASASSGLSNGSLKPMPTIFSSYAPTTVPIDGGVSVASASCNSSPAQNIRSSSGSSLISIPAFSSTVTSVGSSASIFTDTTAPVSTKSVPQNLEVQSSKDSLFSTNNNMALPTSAAPASSVTGIFGLSPAVSASTLGSTSAQLFGSQTTNSVNGSSMFGQSTSNVFSASSSSTHGSGLATSAFGFTAGFGSSSNAASSFSFGSSSGQEASEPFSSTFSKDGTSLTSSMTTSSLFSSSGASASLMTASNLFSSSSASSLSSVTTPSIFGSSSQPTTSSVFGSGATASSFSFGQAPTATSASSFSFGSSGTNFSFTSAPSTTALTPASPAMFGTPAAVTFGTSSPGNDQMNVEDGMADDTVQSQTAMPIVPAFGQVTNTTVPSTFSFGSPQPSGSVPFQFGSQPTAAFNAVQPAFQPTGSLEFGSSAGFSMGSGSVGGSDKSARKMIRVRKDNKNRKK